MRPTFRLAVTAFAAALGIASCNSTPTNGNNCGSGTPPSLVGSYSLNQYTFGSRVWSAPPASGALTLTATTYVQTIHFPSTRGDSTVSDDGTYEVVGATCILENSQEGMRPFSGSLSLRTASNVTTLRLAGSDSLHVIIGVWIKTS